MHHLVDWGNSLMTGQMCVTKIDDEMGHLFRIYNSLGGMLLQQYLLHILDITATSAFRFHGQTQ